MPQYVTVTGDKRFEGVTNAALIPGLHGIGLVDGRKVSIISQEDGVHAVETTRVEVWSAHHGHPASGLRYESSDRNGFRIACVNLATGSLRILAQIKDSEVGSPAEHELSRSYNARVNAAIEALELEGS